MFSEGDQVLLSSENLSLPAGIARKFSDKWAGPFKITKKISPVAYQLELPKEWKIWNTFHVSLLRPFSEPTTFPDRRWHRPPPTDGTTDQYHVEDLLDKRVVTKNGRKVTEYLVKWQGYPIYEATWQLPKDLTGSEVLEMKRKLDAAQMQ